MEINLSFQHRRKSSSLSVSRWLANSLNTERQRRASTNDNKQKKLAHRNAHVRVVKGNLYKGRHDGEARALVEELLALLGAQRGEHVAEHEADRKEEVALARPIPADDRVVVRAERLDDGLVAVALEALERDLRGERGDKGEEKEKTCDEKEEETFLVLVTFLSVFSFDFSCYLMG